MGPSEEVTRVLERLAGGEVDAAEELLPLVYEELRGLAASYFRAQPGDHTLEPTALVHEAYLRLVGSPEGGWRSRAHFFAVASQAMRQVLVDYARRRKAAKRGGDQQKLSLDEARDAGTEAEDELLALNEALLKLEALDPIRKKIVELKYFGGLTIPEIAHVMGLSPRSVDRGWSFAKAWLHREINPNG